MIYFIQESETLNIKIGYTGADDSATRLSSLQVGNSQRLRLLGTAPGDRADERRLHDRFAWCHVSGEWFSESYEILSYIALATELQKMITPAGDHSVLIRTLKVGDKDFNWFVLNQLPIDRVFDWERSAIPWTDDNHPPTSYYVNGNVWGWVKDITTPGYRWIIFEKDGILHKCHEPIDFNTVRDQNGCSTNIDNQFFMRADLPGFRDTDQIFVFDDEEEDQESDGILNQRF